MRRRRREYSPIDVFFSVASFECRTPHYEMLRIHSYLCFNRLPPKCGIFTTLVFRFLDVFYPFPGTYFSFYGCDRRRIALRIHSRCMACRGCGCVMAQMAHLAQNGTSLLRPCHLCAIRAICVPSVPFVCRIRATQVPNFFVPRGTRP